VKRGTWLTEGAFAPNLAGEQKDFEVYSCHVSPDGQRLATAAGGKEANGHKGTSAELN
jgi:hypothetical protein